MDEEDVWGPKGEAKAEFSRRAKIEQLLEKRDAKMVQEERPAPRPKPRGPLGDAVDAQEHNNRLAQEREEASQAQERQTRQQRRVPQQGPSDGDDRGRGERGR